MRGWCLILPLLLVLLGCSPGGPQPAAPDQIAALARAISALSPEVDGSEARRAAQTAFFQTERLALAYQITDPPLIHNAKVNAGLKPRGLCYHWAEDMERLLKAEGFETLGVERAIANADSRILIEHSTAVLVARGAPMSSGIVLDPWRHGGRLFWSPVTEDRRYDWVARREALEKKGQIRYLQRPEGSLAPPPVN